jgi:uncharacterized SAM-binding protein YcdF (DUF218 family)
MRASPIDVFVVMGAGVQEGGSPSGAMLRRLEAALQLGLKSPHPVYLVTGGRKERKPAESEVMKNRLRAAGVADEWIWTDDESTDTLSSVIRSSQIIRGQRNVRSVVVCSDRYHVARCRWLFRLLGVPTLFQPMPSGRKANGTARWIYYYLREVAALPVDTLALAIRRLSGCT